MTKAQVALRFGISRQTIHRWICGGQLDRDVGKGIVRYGPRPAVATKLDPYRSIIVNRLELFPELTSVRLHAEIKAAGYCGSYTQVKEYVRRIRPRPAEEPIVRFETAPGHQGQVDFAEFRLPWGKRYAFLVVLGYSRVLWSQFFPRQTMRVVFDGLEAAFASFGGVPQELLFDQMKAVIVKDERHGGGQISENAEFLRFAHHWGFRVRACRPYRAQTKGKVERPVGYVRSNFFYGRTFTSDDDLNHQFRHWLETVANVRIHGTLKERPIDRFQDERAMLKPLASRPYTSLVLPPKAKVRARIIVPRVDVERRALKAYSQITGGIR